MNALLFSGIIIFTGFLFGELAELIKLPKVTGYIIAGIVLNPQLFGIIPNNLLQHTQVITNFSLAFITFSVGGNLLWPKVKAMGKTVLWITIFESELAFIITFIGFVIYFTFFDNAGMVLTSGLIIAMSVLLGSLASPTDPSATLAVKHEYKAKGVVSDTIMEISAFDDIFGIINFTIAIAIAKFYTSTTEIDLSSPFINTSIEILGGIGIGVAVGYLFSYTVNFFKKETDGALIVMIFSFLALCFGIAKWLGVDELLATMAMGVVVVNVSNAREKIFSIIEKYTEELVFVAFFTISGMHLNFTVLSSSYLIIIAFVIFRIIGKTTGTTLGAIISKADPKVKKFAAFGLFPQGGIVIGLVLVVQSIDGLKPIADVLTAVIIGATVIHELFGPILAKFALKKAKEI